MAGTNKRIAAFILVSLGMHVLLLVPGIGRQLTASVAPSLGTLSVSLQSPPSITEHNTAKTVVQKSQPTARAERVSKQPPTENHPRTADTRVPADLPSHAANRVKHELQARLLTQFEYPLLAVRHGWQGDVQLRFRILANGTLTNIQVAHSSGYALLDRSAMEALRRVHRLRDSEHLLQGREVDMTLPIRYQLTEG